MRDAGGREAEAGRNEWTESKADKQLVYKSEETALETF